MLDSIYHYDSKITMKSLFGLNKKTKILLYCYDCHYIMLLNM